MTVAIWTLVGQRGPQSREVLGGGLRRGVAAVGERVHDGLDAGLAADVAARPAA